MKRAVFFVTNFVSTSDRLSTKKRFIMLVFCALTLTISGYAMIPVEWEVIDLGASQTGYSRAYAINNQGQVTGQLEDYAFFWDASEGMQSLGTISGGVSKGYGINDIGQVVGSSGSMDIGWQAFIWDRDGGMRSIGAYGAQAINNHGQVVGGMTTIPMIANAFIWSQDTGLVSLGTFGGYNSYAYGVNDHGQVVGRYDGYTAFFWDPVDGMIPLGPHGGHALAINNKSEVAGWLSDSQRDYCAYIWRRNEGMTNLGTLGGIYSQAHGINDNSEVVGWSLPADSDDPSFYGGAHAFYWSQATGMIDLNVLLPEDSAWYCLTHATDINNNGQIVGIGLTKNGDMHAFLTTPVPENRKPVANAGEDQAVYAWIDGYAMVSLDGTGSFDPDGDVLEYYWFDANELIETGAEPNVVLGVGEHVIDLIVSDRIADSEPDACTVTVIEPFETTARMLPGVINLKANRPELNGRIEFAGAEMPVLDPNQPMLLLVGDAQIESQDQKLLYSEEDNAWYLRGTFDSAPVLENLTGFEETEIILISRFDSGQWIYGTDIVKVKF